MERKREDDPLASLLLVPSLELCLRHREGVAQMKMAVHVWIRECGQVLAIVLFLEGHV